MTNVVAGLNRLSEKVSFVNEKRCVLYYDF